MSRRTSLFEDVMHMPWPVGVIGAAVAFVILQIYLAFPAEGIVGQAIRGPLSVFVYVFISMLLLASLFSFLTQKIRSKRFRATRSIADIRSLSWKQFESLTAEVFRQQGYLAVGTPEGPDNGVDLVLRRDGEKTYVQCKHWKANTIGVEKVRELLGSMTAGGAQAGIFAASGTYTQPARDFARECGITLIDGEQLAKLLAGVKEEPQHKVKRDSESAVSCPLCNSQMVRRVAKRGKNKGNAFWGCSRYPECHGIRSV